MAESITKKKTRLHTQSGVALWRQIADSLRNDLASFADENGRLPPEPTLAGYFGANRLTLRAAVTALVSEGLLSREQGRGTFINKQKRLKYPISKRTRFSTGLAEQTHIRSMTVLHGAHERASTKVQSKLGGIDYVIRLEILSFADTVPVMRSTTWFPTPRFDGIDTHVRETGSITKALATFGVDDYIRRYTEIEALHSSGEDIDDLRLSPGAIVLITEALNTDIDGEPIQFSISRMAADRVTLRVDAMD